MSRLEIVKRLLKKGHITVDEAVTLLETVVIKEPEPLKPWNPVIGTDNLRPFNTENVPNPLEITLDAEKLVPYSSICPCNPKNGGGGICGCTMGNSMVPEKNVVDWSTTTTITTDEDPNQELDWKWKFGDWGKETNT